MQSPTKKNTKSLPPLSQKQHSYIDRTLQLLQDGCLKDNHLTIDGDIGDYRMKLFRKKDKTDYAKCIHSVFTSSFTDSILPKDANSKEVRDEITNIIKRPYRNSLTPQPQQVKALGEKQVSQKYSKGDIKDILEEEQYLLYNYLPEYQRKHWFEVKNQAKVPPIQQERAQSTISNKKSYSVSKRSNKTRHIFAYLENPLYLQTIK